MPLSLVRLRLHFKLFRHKDREVARRLEILIEYTKIELRCRSLSHKIGKKHALESLAMSVGRSLRTLQRWKSLYTYKGPWGLVKTSSSGRPHKDLTTHQKQRIHFYREHYRWGWETIQAHLKLDDHIHLTRHQIEYYLKTSGLMQKYPCYKIKKFPKKKSKHQTRVSILHPGEHTQLDVKYWIDVLEPKRRCYMYNFIDHASNWSFKRIYERISAKNTVDFFHRLLAVCPFTINRVQTDNGVEFTYKWISKYPDDPRKHPFNELLKAKGIRHKLIPPPGMKELQGLVERSHRQDDLELAKRIRPKTVEEFNQILEVHYKHRNQFRRFKKLGWSTPS